VTTLGEKLTIPAAPTNLAATTVSKTRINLAWSDNSNNENGFTILRSTDGSTWTSVGSAAANSTTYADTNLKPGVKTYYYRVRAFTTPATRRTATPRLPRPWR
jgi:hypothetical protein